MTFFVLLPTWGESQESVKYVGSQEFVPDLLFVFHRALTTCVFGFMLAIRACVFICMRCSSGAVLLLCILIFQVLVLHMYVH